MGQFRCATFDGAAGGKKVLDIFLLGLCVLSVLVMAGDGEGLQVLVDEWI